MNRSFRCMKRAAGADESVTFEPIKSALLHRFVLFFACYLFAHACAGQSLPSYSYWHYSMLNGLVSNEINGVVQDSTGYLWIASNNGLQRFDGVQYKTFKHQEGNAASLPQNVLTQVLADAYDNLWVLGAYGELGIFDKNTFTYKAVTVKVKDPDALTYLEKGLIVDKSGRIFLILRGNELLLYKPEKQEFSSAASFIPLRPEWGITSISQQPGTQKYWMGLQTGGIAIYNHQTGRLSYRGHNIENEPAIDTIGAYRFQHSLFDRQGRVWFENWYAGGYPYLLQYDPRRKKAPLQRYELITTLKTYHELHGFMQAQDGRIWIRGAQVFGYFNEEENRFELIPSDARNEQGIVYGQTTSLYEDREKNIWVTTPNNGMYRFNPSQQFFTNVPHVNPALAGRGVGAVMSFIELRNGDLLTGTWGDGMYRYSNKLASVPIGIKTAPLPAQNPFVWSFCPSADSNTIWMGCQPGLYGYDQAKGTMYFRNPPILQNHTIRQVAEDRAGDLWLGMHGTGVYRWFHPKNVKADSLVKVPEPGNTVVNRILIDSKGWVWIMTSAKGIFVYNSTTGRLMKHWTAANNRDQDLNGHGVSAILEYNDSLMLVSNAIELFFYNRLRDTWSPLHLPDALMGTISSLERDAGGFLWIGTTNALYRYHPQKKILVMLNRLDGITDDRFVLSASHKMKDGRLLFGNTTSFISFHPKSVLMSLALPKVVITSLEAGKMRLRIDSVMGLDQLTLGSKENSISIEFSPLTYSAPALVQYKMEGIDTEWKNADRDNRATFPFLPPSRYTLLLRTVNAEGALSSNPTRLRIRIQPPFYQTWWFYTLVALGLAFELYWLDRQRGLRKKGLQKVRTDISNNLHKEVNEALNNINILSEIARLKSDKEPQKSKEYLEQIHTKSHNMIIAMDDMLWSLDPENDSMDKTINRIKEFADALMQRHPVAIELLIDKNVERLQLNMKLRHEAFLLFKEGLRGLVEAGTPHCIVHLAMEKAKLLFTIEFENEGCNMQQLNNLLQRRDMEARLESLKAKLDVQLHKSRSVFLLQLPLG